MIEVRDLLGYLSTFDPHAPVVALVVDPKARKWYPPAMISVITDVPNKFVMAIEIGEVEPFDEELTECAEEREQESEEATP